jgi:hypothetical protein
VVLGDVADVSEVYSASNFGVGMCRLVSLCVYTASCFEKEREQELGHQSPLHIYIYTETQQPTHFDPEDGGSKHRRNISNTMQQTQEQTYINSVRCYYCTSTYVTIQAHKKGKVVPVLN